MFAQSFRVSVCVCRVRVGDTEGLNNLNKICLEKKGYETTFLAVFKTSRDVHGSLSITHWQV